MSRTNASRRPKSQLEKEVLAVLATLERLGTKATRDGMSRYGIVVKKAYGVPMGVMQKVAKGIGRDHELALALWETGWYEARTVAAFVAEPEKLTAAQMDRWCRDFDNWAICDTVCFKLFDRSPLAFGRVAAWAKRREEFIRRAGFALLASLALHDKATGDESFSRCLPLIEKAAGDDRNFVKKGVSWALRAIGRRSAGLHAASLKLAEKLAKSPEPPARWIGKDALRELTSAAVVRRMRSRTQPT